MSGYACNISRRTSNDGVAGSVTQSFHQPLFVPHLHYFSIIDGDTAFFSPATVRITVHSPHKSDVNVSLIEFTGSNFDCAQCSLAIAHCSEQTRQSWFILALQILIEVNLRQHALPSFYFAGGAGLALRINHKLLHDRLFDSEMFIKFMVDS
ncbi:hypothetical protein NC651_026812 [Populus alba x Populus x berolinensis]|nr:hypothetical protein NC651_026812 [Populus alba x Populus x berolinensis]